MACGLSRDQLDFIFYLYHHRCFKSERAKRYEAIKRDLSDKLESDLDDVIKSLLSEGYLAKTKKKGVNYYIDIGRSKSVLIKHGYTIRV